MLSKSDIEKAVEAVRSLSDIVEKLHKAATWPAASDNDIIRKDAIADPKADPADVALAALADLTRRVDELKAADAKRLAAEAGRKTWSVS
jgi:hypothetical protein